MSNLSQTTGLNPSGSADDSARISAALLTGNKVFLGGGVYRVKGAASSILFSQSGSHLEGMGPQATFIEVDDTAGTVVDAIKIATDVTNCSMNNFTVRPAGASRRTAGRYFSVNGAGSIIGTPAAGPLSNILVRDVKFERGYDGWAVLDGASSKGSWGVRFCRCDYVDFNTGGTVRLVNTPNGGQIFEEQSMMYALDFSIGGVRPAYALRIQGCYDAAFDTVNTVASTRGLVVDPPTGQNTGFLTFTQCEFDSTTEEAVLLTNANGGTILKTIFNGLWASPQDNTKIAASFKGVSNLQMNGGQCGIGATGIKVDACTGVHIVNADVSQNTTNGIWFTGSSSQFTAKSCIANNLGGVTPAVGILIDAGCDHYAVTGNLLNTCTTPITNTPGTSANRRIVSDNVTA